MTNRDLYRGLGQAFEGTISPEEPIEGKLGYKINGVYSVKVPGDDSRYYVRFQDGTYKSLPHRGKVAPKEDLPVIIETDAKGREFISGTNPDEIDAFSQNSSESYEVGYHTHKYGTEMSYPIHMRLIEQFRTQVSAGTKIKISPGPYGGGHYWWPGIDEKELSTLSPASGKHCWIIVGLDKSTIPHSIVAYKGDDYPISIALSPMKISDVSVPSNIEIADAIRYKYGVSTFQETDFLPLGWGGSQSDPIEFPISIENGGTGAETAEDARENLGLEIGVDVQEYNPALDDWALVDPETYLDGVLDDAIIKAPDSATRNTAQPTDPTYPALTLKGAASQSVPILEVKNSSNAYLFYVQPNGATYVTSVGLVCQAPGYFTDTFFRIYQDEIATLLDDRNISITPHGTGLTNIKNPAITTFASSQHNHSNSAGGGTLNASAIAAGTLTHERGGLEADVSAYDGLVRISGGATSAVSLPLSTADGANGADNSTGADGQTLRRSGSNGPFVASSLLKILAGEVVVNDDSADIDTRIESDNLTHALFVDGANGNVGMGAAPNTALHLSRGSANQPRLRFNNTSGGGLFGLEFYGGSSSFFGGLFSNASNASIELYRAGDGSTPFVVFNDTSVEVVINGNLDVNGAVSKNSGSFKIKHPLKSNSHHLVHSFIEGSKGDVIHRGYATLVNGKATVDIDRYIGMTPGTFISYTRDVQVMLQNNETWDAVRGRVEGGILSIECQNPESNAVIDWVVFAERDDKEWHESALTNDKGYLVLEPEQIKVASDM